MALEAASEQLFLDHAAFVDADLKAFVDGFLAGTDSDRSVAGDRCCHLLSSREKLLKRINFVDKYNHSVFNTPILILTSQEKKFEDSEFLGGPVADVMVRPFVPAIVSNRLKVILKQFDSMCSPGKCSLHHFSLNINL